MNIRHGGSVTLWKGYWWNSPCHTPHNCALCSWL